MFDPIQPFLTLFRLVGWIWIIITLRVTVRDINQVKILSAADCAHSSRQDVFVTELIFGVRMKQTKKYTLSE